MILGREHEVGKNFYKVLVICFSWNHVALIESRGITWGKGDQNGIFFKSEIFLAVTIKITVVWL
jgi:hypothetical protein